MVHKAFKDSGLTHREFASKVGVSSGFPNQVFKGTKRLAPDKIRPWGVALGLSGVALEDFVKAGLLSQTPSAIRMQVLLRERSHKAMAQALFGMSDVGGEMVAFIREHGHQEEAEAFGERLRVLYNSAHIDEAAMAQIVRDSGLAGDSG